MIVTFGGCVAASGVLDADVACALPASGIVEHAIGQVPKVVTPPYDCYLPSGKYCSMSRYVALSSPCCTNQLTGWWAPPLTPWWAPPLAFPLVSPLASLISPLASLGAAKATSCTPESTAASSEKCDETGAARTCGERRAPW